MNRLPMPPGLWIFAAACLLAASSAAAAEEADGAFQALLTRQDAAGEIPGWRSFHADAEVKTGDVWAIRDGVLRCQGTPNGYLYTETEHTNFVLELHWRWPPGGEPGNGGVLIRATPPHRIWPKSLEAQINHGQAGDFWGLAGYPLTGPADRLTRSQHPKFGKLTHLKKTADAEKPAGEWNHYQIAADGETVILTINGREVNRATGCPAVAGAIVLTAEGDEIHFRNVRIRPLADQSK